MDLRNDIHWKSLIIGAAISTTIVIIASKGYDFLYLFSAIGLIYVGYKAKNMKMGAILGTIAAIPLAILTYYGGFGLITDSTILIISMISVLVVGAIIGFAGALASRDRKKAKEEYLKKQKIGKKKKKKE
ncbi:hypothetical protein [Methanobrevibacter oralis]|uniref:Uncharacterized protein n=1 Tax=Methanobrevibacter oralis TaxID=66851 RepID=A0A166ARI7_METOA|nr:hypothetical protein [Methanobrevibacter oralis]KZX12382.1 hypothetical protein MBORA_11360 [Methanobrevibacter oralis]